MIAKLLLIVLFFSILSYVQIQAILQKSDKKAAAVYIGLMTVAVTFLLLKVAEIHTPSLITPYKVIFQPIGEALLQK